MLSRSAEQKDAVGDVNSIQGVTLLAGDRRMYGKGNRYAVPPESRRNSLCLWRGHRQRCRWDNIWVVCRMTGALAKIKSSRWLNPIGLVVGGLAIYAVTQPVRPLQPVIGAPAYVWPKKCPKDDFTSKPDEAIIPCACADEKYRILDWPQRGLPSGAKGMRYYRIGNDAVRLSVPFFGLSAEQCWIGGGVANFYR
jgi:hypothetical protein